MTLLDLLFQPYTFEGILKTIINLFGISNLILLSLSYFAVILYISRVPAMSPLSEEITKSKVAPFVQQFFYILSFIPFIKLFFGFNMNYLCDLFHFIVIYILIVVPLFIITKNIVSLSTYESYISLRKGKFWLSDYKMMKNFSGLALFWIILLILFIYFTIYNPFLPLIFWVLVFYSLASAFAIVALTHSFISHIKESKYVCIETIEKEQYKGFLISKDNDLYVIKTSEGYKLILAKQINKIAIITPPN